MGNAAKRFPRFITTMLYTYVYWIWLRGCASYVMILFLIRNKRISTRFNCSAASIRNNVCRYNCCQRKFVPSQSLVMTLKSKYEFIKTTSISSLLCRWNESSTYQEIVIPKLAPLHAACSRRLFTTPKFLRDVTAAAERGIKLRWNIYKEILRMTLLKGSSTLHRREQKFHSENTWTVFDPHYARAI